MLSIEAMLLGGGSGDGDKPEPGEDWGGRPTEPGGITSPSGRYFYPHPNGQGTVMCWDDNGTHRQTFIPRAAYVWSGVSMSPENPYYVPVASLPQWNYAPVPSNYIQSSWVNLTDAQLYAQLYWHDPNTSAYNTDAHVAQYGTSYAAGKARQRTFSDPVLGTFACDLPNFQTLMRIWLDKNYLAQVYPDDNSFWSSWMGGGCAWVSTMYSDGDVDTHNGQIGSDGGCGGVWRGYPSGNRRVLPVHDIAAVFV